MRKMRKWLSLFMAAALAVSSFPGQNATVSAAAAGEQAAYVDEVTEDGLKAATKWYTQDFEGVSDISTVAKAQHASALKLGTDPTKYLSYDFTGDQQNSRGLDMAFDVDVTAEDKYIVEFDSALKAGNNQTTYFTIKDTDFKYISNNVNYGTDSGYILNLAATNSTTFKLNDTADVTIPEGEWCHYLLYVDKTRKLVSTTIKGTTTSDIANKVITSYSGDGNVTGLYMLAGRYYAVMSIDNIKVRAVGSSDDFGQVKEEQLLKAEFTSGLNAKISQPNEPVHYPIIIQATGDLGNDLTDQVSVEWSVTGLEKEDGYISLTKEEGAGTGAQAGTGGVAPGNSTKAYFNVRNGVSNYFGYVTAKVTYKEKTITLNTPFAVIGASAAPATQLAPQTGYYKDMNGYADSLVGYQGTATDITSQDLVLNGWSIYGSNGARTSKLVKDADGTKSIEFASNGGSGSTVAVYQWSDQTSQYVIDFTAKFSADMAFGVYANTPNNKGNDPEWTASYTGGALTVGSESIPGIEAGKWYRYVISADPSSVQKYGVTVYDSTGAKLGEVSDIEMTNSGSVQKYFCFMGTWPMYLQKFEAYLPTVSSMTVVSDKDTVKVPESGEAAAMVSLSAAPVTADGLALTGAVDWSLAEEYANVELASTGAQTADLKVGEGAAGTITVVATMGSVQAEKEIQLTTSSNVVSFKQSTSSIQIPFEGEAALTSAFEAVTLDKDGNILEGQITYTLLGKDGATPTTVNGVALENDGRLVVAAGASPAVVYVKAQNGEGLSNKVKVNIHGLTFSFGSEDQENYTQVTKDTLYTEKLGYGFYAKDGLDETADSITGTKEFRFKAKVPNGNYTVSLNVDMTDVPYDPVYDKDGNKIGEVQRKMKSETVESVPASTGIEKATNANFGIDTFSVAVCDGVLDLTFPEKAVIKTASISQIAAKTALAKPMVYAIGDSTTNNTGDGAKSWGNCVADKDVTLPECFSGFSNNGMAGRDSVNFYNQGRVEAVLLSVCPGDYVTVNMGINSKESGEGASYYTLMSEYYVAGIIQRGGIPVIVTATPDGPVGNNVAADYNSDTGKFTNNRGDGARNNVLRQIATEKELNIIELGQAGEDWMNTFDMDYVNAYNTANGTDHKTVLAMVQSWYVDHNHYKQYLGIWIGNYILGELEKLTKTDKEALRVLCDKTKLYKQEDYEDAGWSDFQAALTAAEAILGQSDATDEAVTNAYNTLRKAAGALVKKTVEPVDPTPGDSQAPTPDDSQASSEDAKDPTPSEEPTPTSYKIEYELGKNGKNDSKNPKSYTSDGKTITLKDPKRAGYIFAGWFTDSKYKKPITQIKPSDATDYTLYAKWTKVTVKAATIKSLKNSKSKQVVVTLTASVKNIDGYEVEYSLKKNFKSGVKKVAMKKTAKTCTIKKLTKGKTYYVRVRAYKKDSTGAKVYSTSKVKSIKIKK